ncbi:zinc-binding dehydrogenase [Gottfriedia acidiceleris]
MNEGLLNRKIGQYFTLEDIVSAHRLIESRQSTGKILLNINN